MKENIELPIQKNFLLKLEVGKKLNSFCNHNIYQAIVRNDNNSEIIMPSKNYFFVGNKFYIPYNNYVNDEYMEIPDEYRYIKIDRIQGTNSQNTEEPYLLVICNEYGKEYSYNYHPFYIQPENIIEKSKEINLEKYYKIQQEYNNIPLFKITPESHNHNIPTKCAVITELHNTNKQFAKLSPESLQYKHYHSTTNDKFIFSYSDITKHKINKDGTIKLHNIKNDITQKIIEDNPIFLIVHNGNFFFTDKKHDGELIDDYNTAVKILRYTNFYINPHTDCSNDIDMNKQFIFKIVKGNLDPNTNKNIVNVELKDKQISLIPKDNNTHLFFDGDNSFQYCNNVREVNREDAPMSGFTKHFFNTVHEILDSHNTYLSIEENKNYQTKTFFSDQTGNPIFDLSNTALTKHISSLFHMDNTQNNIQINYTKSLANTTIDNLKPHNELQDEKQLIPQKNQKDNNLPITNQDSTIHSIADTLPNITYFPIKKEKVVIGDDIGDGKYKISFNLAYDEMLDFYKTIQETYNYDYTFSAFNNIIKYYGVQTPHESNVYINKHGHIFIDNLDFGLLQ
ncbi:Hypothetical protein ERGA_CDS_01210 [Ehrlichia ruminantium str. Gardel]|nr:hypothetical protein [Ehrlichia ruminantium]CAI27573.1 Hypothetical protein ERGA_CDS_01210 [Ehrlichia ruminantium str. Gardel]